MPGVLNRRPAAQQAAAALQQPAAFSYAQQGIADHLDTQQPAAGTGIYPAHASTTAPALPHSWDLPRASQDFVQPRNASLQAQPDRQQYLPPTAPPQPSRQEYQQPGRGYLAADVRSRPADARDPTAATLGSVQSASAAAADAKKAAYR